MSTDDIITPGVRPVHIATTVEEMPTVDVHYSIVVLKEENYQRLLDDIRLIIREEIMRHATNQD